jgi:hypothetical protein
MADDETKSYKPEDIFSDEEIEKILKEKISSGYSKEDIEKIISSAEPVHRGTDVDLSRERPIHKNVYDIVYDVKDEWWNNPTVYFEVNGQPLRILLGINIEPDVEIAETRLHSGFETSDKAAVKHLYFQGDAGLTVECTAIVRTDDIYIGERVGDLNYTDETSVVSVLLDWGRTFQVCKLITNDPIIDKSYYRMKKPTFTHILPNVYQVDLTFVEDTYHYNNSLQTENAMSSVNNVLKVGSGSVNYYDSSDINWTKPVHEKVISTNQGVNVESELVSTLRSCPVLKKRCTCTNYKKRSCNVQYVKCVWYYQKALKQLGYYLDGKHDGLFCYLTKRATVKFQTDNKIIVDGVFGSQTKGVLINKLLKLGS